MILFSIQNLCHIVLLISCADEFLSIILQDNIFNLVKFTDHSVIFNFVNLYLAFYSVSILTRSLK